jgi:hypothetical protein
MPQLKLVPYISQASQWPKQGKHSLAQYDEETVIVYQAYKPAIGHFAAENKFFGGDFKLSRMSWIKTNFLWMMYRSGWGTKLDQEVTLAVWLKRTAFDEIVATAIATTFQRDRHQTYEEWQEALKRSNVRLQWDPNHHPYGNALEQRAIQLGLSGAVLQRYAREWIIDIQDISAFVAEQRVFIQNRQLDKLIVPQEQVYPEES